MTLSRQEDSLNSGRTNQRARTRAALVDAAVTLLRDGRPPSMPEAAARALVSVATAYRYFRTAEELWDDAAVFSATVIIDSDELEAAIEAAGDDVEARVEVVIRRIGWGFIENEVLIRQVMRTSLDRWFAQQGTGAEARPVRPGQRNKWNALALQPLRDKLEDYQVDSLVEALGFVVGAEAVITLLDALQLSPEAAKERQLTTALWILRGGLAEIAAQEKPKPKAKKNTRRPASA
jgi:AcrR family transcriptional regulator